eukprot:TRINITY_DN72881_c0_g1_i1.p1 TRINITY_DN72881_c0_g1~~TRINITY_DN72881_c0_g1_i1.p1  ORF type:complete len:539 (-),score=110.91 TRINITY_DN72881_c0_g1_i1:49-1575(-)
MAMAMAMETTEFPRTLRVLGRPAAEENSDICGEYVYRGARDGRGVYQKAGSTMALYYYAPAARWVIDRNGVTDSEVCVAFADDPAGLEYPASIDLVWRVWDTAAQNFLPDSRFFVVDAPAAVSIFGRVPNRENSALNGEYELVAVHHGRPAYQDRHGQAVIKFDAQDNRWLLCRSSDVGRVCSAYAEPPAGVPAPAHPGCSDLDWTFYEPSQSAFVHDPEVRAVAAPHILHVVGNPGDVSLGLNIFGSYMLAGVDKGAPVYVLPQTKTVLCRAARNDRWLIDVEGFDKKPSMLSRVFQWMDGSPKGDVCSAYAEAHGTAHPANPDLEWQVLDRRTMRYVPDQWVCVTQAPLQLRVRGRCPQSENGIICGDYFMVGSFAGRAAYQKPGSQCVIRYHPASARWVISGKGINFSEECVAYAERAPSSEHPAGAGPWHVFETSRGCHVEDRFVNVTVPADAPQQLPKPGPPALTLLGCADALAHQHQQEKLGRAAAAGAGGAFCRFARTGGA